MATRITGKRRLAGRLTMLVLALQAAVVTAFVLDPGDPPQRGWLWQALWALKHKESFIPLIGLLIVGPPATWLAYSIRGGHRFGLVAGWLIFGAVALAWFVHRIAVMTNLVWEHGIVK